MHLNSLRETDNHPRTLKANPMPKEGLQLENVRLMLLMMIQGQEEGQPEISDNQLTDMYK